MPANTSPRLTLGIIGVGRVGVALGKALEAAGHVVVAAHAISAESKARASRFFPAAPLLEPAEVVASCNLLLLTVSDDQLADLVSGLAATSAFQPGQFVLHASGRHGLLPLLPAIDAGAVGLAIHPAMTFTADPGDVERLRDCPFAITTALEFRAVAEALVLEMGGEPIWINDADRVAYHAALTHAANHLTVLVEQAAGLLADVGVEHPHALLRPLLVTALDNTLARGVQALTGPVSRGDAETVEAHLAELPEQLQSSYRALALGAVDLALAAGRIKAGAADRLRRVLAE